MRYLSSLSFQHSSKNKGYRHVNRFVAELTLGNIPSWSPEPPISRMAPSCFFNFLWYFLIELCFAALASSTVVWPNDTEMSTCNIITLHSNAQDNILQLNTIMVTNSKRKRENKNEYLKLKRSYPDQRQYSFDSRQPVWQNVVFLVGTQRWRRRSRQCR